MDKRAIFPQKDIDISNWYWYKTGFSLEEIQKIEESLSGVETQDAVTYGADKPNLQHRNSKISWIPQEDPNFVWLYDKMIDLAFRANKDLWNFDIHCINESIQYTKYLGGGGHFGWHLDLGPGLTSRRKLSMVVQLSDPTEYEGGVLQIMKSSMSQDLPKDKGAVILFPSYLLHRVTPVVSGIRKSLVLWVGGNHFR
jgi:PKHD-type hydroxylase